MTISVILLVVLNLMWLRKDRDHQPSPTQLPDQEAVDRYLDREWHPQTDQPESTRYIPTGIFVQSLNFLSPVDIQVTGYLWQRYKDGEHDGLNRGFIFPEQINSGSDIAPIITHQYKVGDEEVIVWYFEATLRQGFDYQDYPFDHKVAWLRLWAQDFDKNVILVPDFKSYKSTGLDDTFGVEESIVLGSWNIKESYFDYKKSNYDTNFGIDGYVGQEGFPELYFNIVLKRKVLNAFIVNLLPLFVVCMLLFQSLMTLTRDKEKAEKFGFSTSGVIGASAALFFVVMVAHIQLRQEFAGAGIVYLEYFYFLLYLVIMLVVSLTYLFSLGEKQCPGWINSRDCLIPKLSYWPAILGVAVLLTQNAF